MILLLCTNIATSHKDTRLACQRAFEAGVVHTGHDKKIKKYTRQKEGEYREVIGDEVALFMIAFHTIAIRQQMDVNLRGFATADSAVFRLNKEQLSLNLNWRF